MNIYIVYSSPAGSTATIARRIADHFRRDGESVELYDLAAVKFLDEREKAEPLLRRIGEAGQKGLLFAGSPVYVGHAVPPVLNFLNMLPGGSGCGFVPFTSWGSVSSGIALAEMGGIAAGKGFRVRGACSLSAPHSQMWREADPLGGRAIPLEAFAGFDGWLAAVSGPLDGQAEGGDRAGLAALSALDHPDAQVREDFKKINLAGAASEMTPRKVETEGERACTLCRSCAAVCPVGAIDFEPYPVFNERCIFCFNCVRYCPSTSITADLSAKAEWLRKASDRRGEAREPRLISL